MSAVANRCMKRKLYDELEGVTVIYSMTQGKCLLNLKGSQIRGIENNKFRLGAYFMHFRSNYLIHWQSIQTRSS